MSVELSTAPRERGPGAGAPSPDQPRSRARYVVIGVGGLGCPALLGLIAGGVDDITIIDDDHVALSNLPRQVLFATTDIGVAKVDAARWSLRARAPADPRATLELDAERRRLEPEQLPALIERLVGARPELALIVLECSDSPTLKFAVHDACVAAGVAVVVGGVVGWHGQAMAVDPRRPEAACYRCLFESPPPPELSPACASVGVSGPVAGAVGHAMAMLALGLAGDPSAPSPAGVCVHFDLLTGSARRLAPAPRPDCPTCRNGNLERAPT